MVSFRVVMREVFTDGRTQGVLTEENHSVQAFFVDRPHESLGESVQVRRSRAAASWYGEGNMARSRLTGAARHSGGVVTDVAPRNEQVITVRWQHAFRVRIV